MKAPLASWGILLVLLCATVLLNNVAAKKHEGNWDDVQGVAKSCDDCEEEEVTAEDAMTLVKPFLCGKPLARDRKEPLSKISPHLEDLLSEFHARNGTETDTQDKSSTSDADASGGTHVGGSHVEAARKTSSVFPLLHNATLDHQVSQHIIKLKKINLKPNIKDEALSGSNTSRDYDGNHLAENHVMLCPKDPWASNPSCALHVGDTLRGPLRSAAGGSILWPRADGSLMFGKYQEAPSTEGGGRGEGAGPEAMRFTTLLHSDSNVVRSVIGMRRSKVRVFRGKRDNESGRKMGMARGSVPLVQRLEKSSMDDIGTVTDVPEADKRQDSERRVGTAGGWLPSARRVEKTNLDETGTPTDDVDSVTEVKRNVWGIQTTKVHDVGGQGNDDDLGIEKGTAGGWLPWARRDEKNRLNEIGTAADKTGEVCASVSNKGCVKVTVDGITVLSKSGPYTWDWLNRLPWTRPTDDGYELHVTDDGMEIRLGEETIWGVNPEEWIG